MYIAEEGKVYRNKINGITAKTLLIGLNDSIDNYEIIDEPQPIEEEEEEESIEENIE